MHKQLLISLSGLVNVLYDYNKMGFTVEASYCETKNDMRINIAVRNAECIKLFSANDVSRLKTEMEQWLDGFNQAKQVFNKED